MSLEERNYTTTLASTLDAYLENTFERAYTPNERKQAFNKLDTSKCFDLIKRINESSLLILEIKVTDDNKIFRSYNQRQHIINMILRKCNIPIEYCYNLVDDYSKLRNEQVLVNSNTSEPSIVCDENGNITNYNKHINLKNLIDSMIKAGGTNGDSFNSLLSEDFIKNLQDTNIQLLFFVYNANNREILTFNTKELTELYSIFSKEITNQSKIDFKTANTDEIEKFFLNTKNNISRVLNDYILNKFIKDIEQEQTNFQMLYM
ncbi:hypothetical protein Abu_0919 [Aliarcobacter butzleri RM4018]|uniref:Uncharacterized protein n=1 Tax=Aliarcobacter butzleri (strain RM4018) TaxID=367737 RepID=A8ETA5_ALIB4|nr:hypothetical protein [Aliarcobacter butzleri]ABV67179.1 hypothetical protein Abu_0919 [Aliarcobacter butzleri RM4018]GGT81673.1 hypothetical protein GCM10007985_18040 [Aliarcobacter butzleri]SNV27137.1 Uncharacterised protein [Aliarcobacter butzleri]